MQPNVVLIFYLYSGFVKLHIFPVFEKIINREFTTGSIQIVADVFLLVHFRLSIQLLLFDVQVLKIAIFCYKKTRQERNRPVFFRSRKNLKKKQLTYCDTIFLIDMETTLHHVSYVPVIVHGSPADSGISW
jgi:hypothetical protein